MKLSWQQIPSTVVTDILCLNSDDGLVIDNEHASFNPETLYACIQIATANGKKCFVRLPEISTTLVRRCLDAGATGLIFSTVETKEQVDLISNISLYPSQGSAFSCGRRGLGLVRQNKWGLNDLIGKPPVLIAQIETTRGVENIEEIWAAGIFDFCMIGPYDLSSSLGSPGIFDSVFEEQVRRIKDTVPVKNMGVHIPTNVKAQIKNYEGYGMIAYGMDTTFIIESYRKCFDA